MRPTIRPERRSVPDNTTPTFASPIHQKPAIQPGARLTLRDETLSAKVVVKGDAADNLGARFGSCAEVADRLVCHFRPQEVTIIGPFDDVEAIIASVPTTGFTSVIDWSHRGVLLRLAGVDAIAALSKLCSLDLSDHMFPHHACTTTQIAGITCELARDDRDNVASFLIGSDRSFGQYLYDTVLDAGEEFGISPAPSA